MGSLDGRTALVTGAAHGQGRSHAITLAREGADLIAIDVCAPAADVGYPLGTMAELEETRELVEKEGRRCHIAKADVRDRAALERIYAETTEEFPRLDVIVANAAISALKRFFDNSQDQWDEMIDINLTGVFKLLHVFARRTVDAGNGGSIILISSFAGTKGVPLCAPYTAAKHGVQGLMKTLALELGEFGIRVNTINPGAVASAMTEDPAFVEMEAKDPDAAALFRASFAQVLPMPEDRLIQPSDISEAVLWLAADTSRWVTGTELAVDAGVAVR